MNKPRKTGTQRPLDPRKLTRRARLWHLHARLLLSIAFGVGRAGAAALPGSTTTRVLVGWDAGVALHLALTYRIMASASADRLRRIAAIEDEGDVALLVLTTAAAVAGLAAVVIELGEASSPQRVVLGVGTILLSWLFMHSIFAVHYAREFDGEGREAQIGGLEFPGKDDPDYWDFLYYSLVVAMTAQVSDVHRADGEHGLRPDPAAALSAPVDDGAAGASSAACAPIWRAAACPTRNAPFRLMGLGALWRTRALPSYVSALSNGLEL